MTTAERLSVAMLGAFAVAFVAALLGLPRWVVWVAFAAACLLGIVGFAYSLFPPRRDR